jgi:uncharacterized membrane protein YphA (DoxX/SURF4 family)
MRGFLPHTWSGPLMSLMRFMFGLLILMHGTQKLFGWPAAFPMEFEMMTKFGIAGILETGGGLLMMLGLLTRPVAFILAGEMNLTALLALSRNYAIAGQDLDRAVELARKAVERATEMKGAPVPPNYSATSWTSYVAEAEQSAKDILVYVLAIRDRNQPASEKP